MTTDRARPIGPAPPVTADLFAGGGGFTHGARRAGADVVVAVNHNEHAIANHKLNHPHVLHLCESVWAVDPRDALQAAGGRALDLLLASPDCRHFSVAKGAPTKDKGIRGLAWVVLRWAAKARPRCILLENVAEFRGWGPLKTRGGRRRVWKERAGETFARFVGQLEALGYVVEYRVLNAADYGTPTSRRRLFVIARCDGRPIRWPDPTHGPGRAAPWRTAAEVIDWSLPCPSIFDRKRPLKPATLRRIAEGIRRFVLECASPFMVTLTHGGRVESIGAPVRTVTAAHRGEQTGHQSRDEGKVRSADAPLSVVVTKAEHCLVAPVLVETRNGERQGQSPRVRSVEVPVGTVTAQGSQGAVVAAFLAKHNGKTVGQTLSAPVDVVTGRDTKALVAAHVTKLFGTSTGSGLDEPAPTVTAGGNHAGLVEVELAVGADHPRAAQVAVFLCLYYSSGGQWQGLSDPLKTIVAKARFGLVTVTISGVECAIVDIGMRMLQPHELAAANGAADMVFTGTKEQRTARIGNLVCPPVAQALVAANFPPPLSSSDSGRRSDEPPRAPRRPRPRRGAARRRGGGAAAVGTGGRSRLARRPGPGAAAARPAGPGGRVGSCPRRARDP